MATPEQQTAANNIRRAFLEGRLRYAILMAQCQSGKTGAFLELARSMLAAGEVMRVYILCGSSETELRDQAKQRAEEALPAGKFTVLFRQDFEKASMNITNSLIIVDESHLDQNKGSQLHKFMKRHGLSMDGNPAVLEAKNAYLVSVDATPYSELASLIHKETPYPKHPEELMPGPGYFGLGDYKGTGRLQPTFDFVREPERFAALLRSQERKWLPMRLNWSKTADADEAILKAICVEAGAAVKYFTADETERPQISAKALEAAPDVTTVVIIRGRLRAGKTLPKRHIGFAWEGAADPKTDALVQGLPGRMCGYDFDGEYRPTIFVAPAALREYEDKVVKASEMGRAVLAYPIAMPQKATNLKKAHVANVVRVAGQVRTQCVPLAINYDMSDAGYEALWNLHASSADFRTACHTLLRQRIWQLRAAVANSPNYTPEQKAEIQGYLTAQAEPHFRRAPQKKYYGTLIEAHKTSTTPAEHISDAPNVTLVVYHPEYSEIAGAVANRVFVIFYTNAGPKMDLASVNLASRIPRTNGKSIFTPDDMDFDEPPVAGGVAGFRQAAIQTPAAFEAALTEYLTAWRDAESLTFARLIQSAGGRFALDKRAFNYKGKEDNDVMRICARVGAAFGVRLAVKFARSSAGEGGHFNVKEISW
jgi:hypothetical protein